MKIIEYTSRKPSLFLRKGIGVFYSERNGYAVLKNQTHWLKISGIWINTKWGSCWIRFRRFHKGTLTTLVRSKNDKS